MYRCAKSAIQCRVNYLYGVVGKTCSSTTAQASSSSIALYSTSSKGGKGGKGGSSSKPDGGQDKPEGTSSEKIGDILNEFESSSIGQSQLFNLKQKMAQSQQLKQQQQQQQQLQQTEEEEDGDVEYYEPQLDENGNPIEMDFEDDDDDIKLSPDDEEFAEMSEDQIIQMIKYTSKLEQRDNDDSNFLRVNNKIESDEAAYYGVDLEEQKRELVDVLFQSPEDFKEIRPKNLDQILADEDSFDLEDQEDHGDMDLLNRIGEQEGELDEDDKRMVMQKLAHLRNREQALLKMQSQVGEVEGPQRDDERAEFMREHPDVNPDNVIVENENEDDARDNDEDLEHEAAHYMTEYNISPIDYDHEQHLEREDYLEEYVAENVADNFIPAREKKEYLSLARRKFKETAAQDLLQEDIQLAVDNYENTKDMPFLFDHKLVREYNKNVDETLGDEYYKFHSKLSTLHEVTNPDYEITLKDLLMEEKKNQKNLPTIDSVNEEIYDEDVAREKEMKYSEFIAMHRQRLIDDNIAAKEGIASGLISPEEYAITPMLELSPTQITVTDTGYEKLFNSTPAGLKGAKGGLPDLKHDAKQYIKNQQELELKKATILLTEPNTIMSLEEAEASARESKELFQGESQDKAEDEDEEEDDLIDDVEDDQDNDEITTAEGEEGSIEESEDPVTGLLRQDEENFEFGREDNLDDENVELDIIEDEDDLEDEGDPLDRGNYYEEYDPKPEEDDEYDEAYASDFNVDNLGIDIDRSNLKGEELERQELLDHQRRFEDLIESGAAVRRYGAGQLFIDKSILEFEKEKLTAKERKEIEAILSATSLDLKIDHELTKEEESRFINIPKSMEHANEFETTEEFLQAFRAEEEIDDMEMSLELEKMKDDDDVEGLEVEDEESLDEEEELKRQLEAVDNEFQVDEDIQDLDLTEEEKKLVDMEQIKKELDNVDDDQDSLNAVEKEHQLQLEQELDQDEEGDDHDLEESDLKELEEDDEENGEVSEDDLSLRPDEEAEEEDNEIFRMEEEIEEILKDHDPSAPILSTETTTKNSSSSSSSSNNNNNKTTTTTTTSPQDVYGIIPPTTSTLKTTATEIDTKTTLSDIVEEDNDEDSDKNASGKDMLYKRYFLADDEDVPMDENEVSQMNQINEDDRLFDDDMNDMNQNDREVYDILYRPLEEIQSTPLEGLSPDEIYTAEDIAIARQDFGDIIETIHQNRNHVAVNLEAMDANNPDNPNFIEQAMDEDKAKDMELSFNVNNLRGFQELYDMHERFDEEEEDMKSFNNDLAVLTLESDMYLRRKKKLMKVLAKRREKQEAFRVKQLQQVKEDRANNITPKGQRPKTFKPVPTPVGPDVYTSPNAPNKFVQLKPFTKEEGADKYQDMFRSVLSSSHSAYVGNPFYDHRLTKKSMKQLRGALASFTAYEAARQLEMREPPVHDKLLDRTDMLVEEHQLPRFMEDYYNDSFGRDVEGLVDE